MGSSEKRSRKRRSSESPPTEEGESRSKKHHRTRDNDKERRRSSSSKRDDKKSHKHSKHTHDKGKNSKDKRREQNSCLGFAELSTDDYFSKSNEFATWLKEKKRIFFSDLSSEDARSYFSSFIKKWNNGRLEPRYYEGITTGPRTAHNWKIKAK